MGSDYPETYRPSNPLGPSGFDTSRRMGSEDTDEADAPTLDQQPSEGWLAKDIGSQIRKLRLERGLSIGKAARASGTISKAMLGQVEKDGQNVGLEKIEGVLRVLKLRVRIEPEPDPSDSADLSAPAVLHPRRGVVERFAKIIPFIPDEEVEIFLQQLSLWERRHKPANG